MIHCCHKIERDEFHQLMFLKSTAQGIETATGNVRAEENKDSSGDNSKQSLLHIVGRIYAKFVSNCALLG